MLSLSPRYDLIKFQLPKTFIPKEVEEKYTKLINTDANTMKSSVEYLNESIQGINFPGVSDVVMQHAQRATNDIKRSLGKLNVEPKVDVSYQTPSNPLDKIEHSFKVTFRTNQGLYNYFMLYETLFHQICKPIARPHQPVFYIELLNEVGEVTAKIVFKDVLMNGMDGMEFNYNKQGRESGTFDVNFKFNNIDFEFVENKVKKENENVI